MQRQNLAGRIFDRLVVIRPARPIKSGRHRFAQSWVWCICGVVKIVHNSSLLSKRTRSCGCLKMETRATNRRHGMTGTRTYSSWQCTLRRCSNPAHEKYPIYGGAGIKVCKRWYKFENFLADMGVRPEGTTLGRLGDVGNYSRGDCEECLKNGWKRNCEWQTHGNRPQRGLRSSPRRSSC